MRGGSPLGGTPLAPRRHGRFRRAVLAAAAWPAPGAPGRPPGVGGQGRGLVIYVILWLLGVPLTVILLLFLVGIGR